MTQTDPNTTAGEQRPGESPMDQRKVGRSMSTASRPPVGAHAPVGTKEGLAMQPLNALVERAAREVVQRIAPHFGTALATLVNDPAWQTLLAILFYLQWLSEDIPALVTGKIPQSVMENGLLTNPVHVLDMGLLLPAMIITAILLWRRKPLGYILAIPLLVFSILTGIGMLAIFVAMSMKGMPTSLAVELFFAVMIVISLVLSWLYVREEK
jgi:hypothetical protein